MNGRSASWPGPEQGYASMVIAGLAIPFLFTLVYVASNQIKNGMIHIPKQLYQSYVLYTIDGIISYVGVSVGLSALFCTRLMYVRSDALEMFIIVIIMIIITMF